MGATSALATLDEGEPRSVRWSSSACDVCGEGWVVWLPKMKRGD
jgi:hypothetical protein